MNVSERTKKAKSANVLVIRNQMFLNGHNLTMSTIPVMRPRRNSKSVNVNYLKGLKTEVADVYLKTWGKRR